MARAAIATCDQPQTAKTSRYEETNVSDKLIETNVSNLIRSTEETTIPINRKQPLLTTFAKTSVNLAKSPKETSCPFGSDQLPTPSPLPTTIIN